jgi:hypothetical protein
MGAYDQYYAGSLEDFETSDEDIKKSINKLEANFV